MNPTYDVKIGNLGIRPAGSEDMESLEVRASMDVPADSFDITVRPTSGVSKVKRGDAITTRLGYDSNQTPVFSGAVDMIEAGVSQVRISGLSQTVKLLLARVDQSYIGQSAGSIVKDLCNKAKVTVGDVQDGVSLPSFFLSGERPVFDYIAELASISGYDVYFTPANKLAFRAYHPSKSHKLTFGENVLKIDVAQSRPAEGMNLFGESPSSSRGSNTTHWLTKDEVKGSAGSGQRKLVTDPIVKDTSTATSVAKSMLDRARQTIVATIVCTGRPDIKLGEEVNLHDFPHASLSGGFKIRTIEHSLNKRTGFTTRLVCSKEA